jgi:hypothetical protein
MSGICRSTSSVRMKIVIQRHTSALLRPGPFLSRMSPSSARSMPISPTWTGVYTALAKKGGRRRSESLIEE